MKIVTKEKKDQKLCAFNGWYMSVRVIAKTTTGGCGKSDL